MLCLRFLLSWEKRRSAQRQFPMSPSRLSLHIHKERKAPPQPVMNGSSVNRGLSPLTLRITQKCLYVHHLSVSPRALFASDSWAISVRYRGSLCLSRNVIHFRRQTVVHSGGGWVVIMDEGQRTAGWGAAFVYACVYLAWLHPGELSFLSCNISCDIWVEIQVWGQHRDQSQQSFFVLQLN